MAQQYVEGKIVELIPEAVDTDDIVYTQYVVLEFYNKRRITIFDADVECKKRFLGKKKKFDIEILFPDVTKSQNKEKKIVCEDTIPTPTSYVLYGEVVDKLSRYDYYKDYADSIGITEADKNKDSRLILDIGVGTIKVDLDRADHTYERFSIGDYVKVSGGRVDLVEILGDNQNNS